MRNKPRHLLSILTFGILFILSSQIALIPCTVAVVSGKATINGRPLLWKNRDTLNPDNKVVFIQGERYEFLAVVNSNDTEAVHVWQGINTQGFAIMNSLARDMVSNSSSSKPPQRIQGMEVSGFIENGIFMRKALGQCADVEEFEKLLVETNGKRMVAANYGVIDASGSACFFETGAESFTKFDANDPKVAPQGYIVRTNFAFTAKEKKDGSGYIRFERVSSLFQRAAAEGRLDYRFILQEAARDLVNEKLHSNPLAHTGPHDLAAPLYIRANDTLNRISTMSVSVFQGAPSPDKAYLTTMWTLLGQPICGVAVPMWVYAGGVPEEMTGAETAPMNDLAKKLVVHLYPDPRANMKQYLSVTRLLSYGGSGFLNRLYKIENQVMADTEKQLQKWQDAKPTKQEILDFMRKNAAWSHEALKKSFADILD